MRIGNLNRAAAIALQLFVLGTSIVAREALATAGPASGGLRGKLFGGKGPVNLKSETMTIENKKKLAVWRGGVVAVQADMTLKCDELQALYDDKGVVSTLTARGNVHLTQPGRVARSGQALFNNQARTILFTGAPKVWERENTLEGDRIMVWVDEDRVEVTKARGQLRIKDDGAPRNARKQRGAR